MTGTVPAASILCMAISGVIGFAIPVVLFFYVRIKKKADILPFFVGCAVMLVFALVLEAAVHRAVFSSPAGETIQNTTWLYALYGGVMAGLFEETGRFVAFKTVLKKKQGKDSNALMYGAGHGGFEAAVLLGITMINNIIWSVLINSGSAAMLTGSVPESLKGQVEETMQQLVSTSAGTYLLGGIERIFAVTLQIALSVLVWFAAKNKKRLYLYPAAILIHFGMDAGVVLLRGAEVPAIALEGIVGAVSVATAFAARAVWKKENGT